MTTNTTIIMTTNTFEFHRVLGAVVCGTALSVRHSGIPAVILPEACHLGWQESLMLLAKLVEAEIEG